MSSNVFGRWWQQNDKIQGYLFDGAMILVNFYILASIRRTPLEKFTDLEIGILLAAGVLTQFLGALLKFGPLQQRFADLKVEKSETREGCMGCLSFIHFIFFLVVVGMSLSLVGLIDLNESNSGKEFVWVLVSMLIAAVVSGTVWLAVRSPSAQNGRNIWLPYQEGIANVLLWISALIITRFFWTALLLESEPPSYMGLSMRAFVYIAAVSALFMMFYVPARLLFLAEDYKYPMTWLRLWLVAMFPLLTIVLLGSS